jgi:amino acid permease
MGIIQALVIYSILSLTALYSLHLLIICAQKTKSPSYESMVKAAFGPVVAIIFQIVIVAYTFGVVVGYVIIVGDLIPPVMAAWIGKGEYCFNPK